MPESALSCYSGIFFSLCLDFTMKHELTIMSTLNEVDTSSVNGSEKELSTQGEAVGEQTPQRRHADALLDLSEEVFMNELEPHEYHCYPGWEEAVRILLLQTFFYSLP